MLTYVMYVQGSTAMSMDEWFCGRPINSGIESRYALRASTMFTTSRYRITSIAVTLHERHTIAVLGTSTGHLLKVPKHCYVLVPKMVAGCSYCSKQDDGMAFGL